MLQYFEDIQADIKKAISDIFETNVAETDIVLNETKKEFEGDITFVVFPFVKTFGKSPEVIGNSVGEYLTKNSSWVEGFNIVKGFLNLTLTQQFWAKSMDLVQRSTFFQQQKPKGEKVLVEFASPNTNKPLHLGHIRNILLGWSCTKILRHAGYEAITTQVINDRGIAICKSMLAWQKFGNGSTPQSTGIKGDHFVGDYYVRFEQEFVKEYNAFADSPEGKTLFRQNAKEDQDEKSFFKAYKNQYFNEISSLGAEARDMLRKWEHGDEATVALWKKMNGWVYEGFDQTYQTLGVSFDTVYYESETYLLGKKVVDEGLEKGIFYKLPDTSVWIDLEDVGMDKKIVLRSDGTSVYITQDIGTAMQRYRDLGTNKMVYTVADEQDYHFKVLFEIIKRLGEPYADGLHHLSYGMVELPDGRMKSREGTVVDADDLIAEVIREAKENAGERGELNHLSQEEQQAIFAKIGLGAVKFFIIKVQPQKKMIFDPKESVDMQGATGPYIQNAYVRIQSMLRKSEEEAKADESSIEYNAGEKALLFLLLQFQSVVSHAASHYEPSGVANYAYALAKEFHKYYHDTRILGAESPALKQFRLALSKKVAEALETTMNLLGIDMPDRM